MDQVQVRVKKATKGHESIFADPKMRGYHDLLIKGGSFYAVFDPDSHLWSQNLQRLGELIDRDIQEFADSYESPDGNEVTCMLMQNTSNGCWNRYISGLRNLADSDAVLNQRIIFANDTPKRDDYATVQLEYAISEGDTSAYDRLMNTLYAPSEREKLEWGIGALVDGNDIQRIQKMFVIYGDPGTGKSTILNIIEMLFPGYIAYFNAEELGKGYQFSTASFKNSPLIGIQTDGDLSHMWDNTLLNQIAAHEKIVVNEKGIKQYTVPLKTMLFMATNKPVKITDAKSGITRRLIDIYPTGNTLEPDDYFDCMKQIGFELGAIAYHCREVYRKLGVNRYSQYRPTEMIAKTNDVYTFVQDNIDLMDIDEPVRLTDLWRAYKEWCEEAHITDVMKRSEFMFELASYFETMNRGASKAVTYHGFQRNKFESRIVDSSDRHARTSDDDYVSWLRLAKTDSRFDELCHDCPAQYARDDESGSPVAKWAQVSTTLKDLDTSRLHWVKVPENHIVIDFDIRGEDGEKSLQANLEAARKFPPTYAEVSKSGQGLHLHYIYDGDVSRLKNLYDIHVEIKVFRGNSSLRRLLSLCNDHEISHISSGLPLKGEKSVINQKELKDEQHLRNVIKKALRKECCPGTKPSVEFIKKLMDEMYESGKPYDVTDMRNEIFDFALRSTHWSDYCIVLVNEMKFKSDDIPKGSDPKNADILTFFDVEVFPNLFMVCFMKSDSDVVKTWINPQRQNIMTLLDENLVGFNNRKYDNHILWAWGVMGYNNAQLYDLSMRIVSGNKNAMFGQAYNASYTDIYDFSAKKQSLKKWEIELGIDHHELGMPWDQPVPEDKWPLVQSYCEDDVRATKAVFEHLKEDFTARQMLAMLSGLTVNDTTNTHTAQIIFGNNKHPQPEFNFPELSEMFPGYAFDRYALKDKKSQYMGEYPGEGGYVWVYGMENGNVDQDYKDIPHPWEVKNNG